MTGSPPANGTAIVTGQPDRTSFEIALAGAAGSYSGGTVTYQTKYAPYRLWVVVLHSYAVRVIVSD